MKKQLITGFIVSLLALGAHAEDLRAQARVSLEKAVAFFPSVSSHGGYVYAVTPDLKQRWGEEPADPDTVEVQPPGTPAVGQSYLRIYRATGHAPALAAARATAEALIRGQNKHGGWAHTIDFAHLGDETVSFDDDQSQSAISFLLALNQVAPDPELTAATQRALAMMLKTQLPNGGWPHLYPARGNYHDYATFNDNGINDCVRVMLEALRIEPKNEAIRDSLRRVARFIVISQQPPPQPGWAQQYNEFLQPAWARTFEPPSVCPSETVNNVETLIDLYLALGDATLLEPIPDALRWVNQVRLPNGRWARFVELGTNQPLYYDRGRIRMNSPDDLSLERRTGYGYQIDVAGRLASATARYEQALRFSRAGLQRAEAAPPTLEQAQARLSVLTKQVEKIIAAQEPSGAWITRQDRFKTAPPKGEHWQGDYTVADRISSGVFNRHVAVLCEYLELHARVAAQP